MYWENLYNKKNKANKPVELDYFQQEKVKEYRQLADDANRWLDLPTVPSRLSSSGISIPGFLHEEQDVRNMQAALGVEEDGDWGPVTEKAFRTTLINQRDGAENAISEIFAAAAAEQERADKAQPQLAYGTAQVGQYLAAPASVQKPVYLTADGSRTNVPTGTSPKQEQVYLTADGKRTNVPGITASPGSSGSKGSTGTAAYDRTMQTADASRLGGTAKSTLAAPTYNRTALTADVPHGAAAERGNIYNTADGKRTNVPVTVRELMEAAAIQTWGQTANTPKKNPKGPKPMGGAVSSSAGQLSDGYRGGAVPEWVVDEKTGVLLEKLVKEAEQRYRDYEVGLNVRGAEGMARRAEKQRLYNEWQKAEANLNAYYLRMEQKKLDAVQKEDPQVMIDYGVEAADTIIDMQGYTKENYPKNHWICIPKGTYQTEEGILSGIGSMLNRFTEVSDQEHMCNLYRLTMPDGSIEYAAGTVVTGGENNVILPYLADFTGSFGAGKLENEYPGAKAEYLGMLHSHPSRSNPANDNDEFSWGDGLVAAVSGKIYLTTPHGNVYALSQEDAKTVIDTGLDWDKTVFAQKKKPLLKALWYGLNPTDAFYYNVLADYDEHRKKAAQTLPGYNYETFDAKTYNTYK